MNEGKNIYCTEDVQGSALPAGPKVFLSHRAPDKPIARAIASVLSALDVHYWLDENDLDLQRAAALGWLGDSRLVHAIERGVRHCTALLGLLSGQTVGSWWVPYENRLLSSGGKVIELSDVPSRCRCSSTSRVRDRVRGLLVDRRTGAMGVYAEWPRLACGPDENPGNTI
jgi:hypothetical protein